MPNITIQLWKISTEKKKALIEKVSRAAAEVTEIPVDKFLMYVEEYDTDCIGVGGRTLTEFMAKD
ncbi:MAG: 4-oxalocrotonate tautomerase [Spirochaetes bacterium]|nr:MAG: 4-oxalocrotonate tautomerase [Spirochaetota bacterium]